LSDAGRGGVEKGVVVPGIDGEEGVLFQAFPVEKGV
jgi:hypothetical protein